MVERAKMKSRPRAPLLSALSKPAEDQGRELCIDIYILNKAVDRTAKSIAMHHVSQFEDKTKEIRDHSSRINHDSPRSLAVISPISSSPSS